MVFADLGLFTNLLWFAAAACVIAVVGTKLTRLADEIADQSGLGEAVIGAVLLGASTSIPGIVTSLSAAADNHPELAVSNAIGGIVAQTAFLAVADITYRRANLEHAAADETTLIQAALLILLLSTVLIAGHAPGVFAAWPVHPATAVLFGTYAVGMMLTRHAQAMPMWRPRQTPETRQDTPDEDSSDRSMRANTVKFAAFAAVLAVAGFVVSRTGVAIAAQTGIGETSVGIILTSVVTSLPELVTSLAAVRRGALQLALGGIIGGNMFDVLFVAGSDIAYTSGSIYHTINSQQHFWILLATIMTVVLLLGLLRRQKDGPAKIGFESATLLALYGVGLGIQILVWS